MRTLLWAMCYMASCIWVSAHGAGPSVLVFSRTTGYRHPSIERGVAMLDRMAVQADMHIHFSEDPEVFQDHTLAEYDVVVFLSTTGDVLGAAQQAAFERYIRSGRGYVGIHAASDTEYDWPWYGQLVGAYFKGHPEVQRAEVLVEDHQHSSTSFLPRRWSRTDEWYDFRSNPRGDVHVLASVDEETYQGGTMGYDHPLVWCHEYDGGRAWYTALGHTDETYDDTLFQRHVGEGIRWAAGIDSSDATASMPSSYQRNVLLENLDQPVQLCAIGGGKLLIMERGGHVYRFDERTASVTTVARFDVRPEGEYGALGMALAHDFAQSRAVYFLVADVRTRMHRVFRSVLGDSAFVTSRDVTIIEIPFDPEECCHAAGDLAVAADGSLFISLGDNTNPFETGYAPVDERPGNALNDAQRTAANTNDLRGKILHIVPRVTGGYGIPGGNLFGAGVQATRPEIYAMGVRNPFRMALDPTSGDVWWGDVGPDATDDSPRDGSKGYDEINRARTAGNFGWPYAIGPNLPYVVHGASYDMDHPRNTSVNSTGLRDLPLPQPATIWYPYTLDGASANMGAGGRTACAGAVVRPAEPGHLHSLPTYFDGSVLLYDFVRCWIRAALLDDNNNVLKVVPVYQDTDRMGIIDMVLDEDRTIYALTWQEKIEPLRDGRLVKISSATKGHGPPQAKISASTTSGPIPLRITFDAGNSRGQIVRYEWDVDGNGTTDGTTREFTCTYPDTGTYRAHLHVYDNRGMASVTSVEIVSGNSLPVIHIISPRNGQVVALDSALPYMVMVSDAEDASLPDSGIVVQRSLGHDLHSHPVASEPGRQGVLPAIHTEGHAAGSNLYGVVTARVTDKAVGDAHALTSAATAILQPVRKRGEHMQYTDALRLEPTKDEGGGQNLAFIDHGDYFWISPLYLADIGAIRVRYAGHFGGALEIHANTPDGPLVGTISDMPSTGDFQNWSTATANVHIDDTSLTYYFVARNTISKENIFNVNWMEFIPRPWGTNSTPATYAYSGSISAHPVPARTELSVTLDIDPASSTRARAHLVDVTGRTLWMQTVCEDPGSTSFTIDVTSYATGHYVLHVDLGGRPHSIPIVICR